MALEISKVALYILSKQGIIRAMNEIGIQLKPDVGKKKKKKK